MGEQVSSLLVIARHCSLLLYDGLHGLASMSPVFRSYDCGFVHVGGGGGAVVTVDSCDRTGQPVENTLPAILGNVQTWSLHVMR